MSEKEKKKYEEPVMRLLPVDPEAALKISDKEFLLFLKDCWTK